jgi:hypothetical protein
VQIEGRNHAYDLLDFYRVTHNLKIYEMQNETGIAVKTLQRVTPTRDGMKRGIDVLRKILRVTGGVFEVGRSPETDLESDIAAWSHYAEYMRAHVSPKVTVMARDMGMQKRHMYAILSGDIAEDQSYDGVGLLRTISRLYDRPVTVTGYPI